MKRITASATIFPVVCNYLSGCLLKGTATKNATQIAQEIDRLGISLSANSLEDYSKLSLLTVPYNFMPSADLLLEVLTQPSFPEAEISKVKEDILARIK